MGRDTPRRQAPAHRETPDVDHPGGPGRPDHGRPLGADELSHPSAPVPPARSDLDRRKLITLIGSGVAATAGGLAAVKVVPALRDSSAGAVQPTVQQVRAGSVAGSSMGSNAAGLRAAPVAATGTSAGSSATTAAKTDYQNAATGKAPAANAGTVVKQPPTVLPLDQALHLARRAAWGPTPTLVAEIRRSGTAAWITRQLTPASIPDPVCDGLLAQFDTLGMTPAQLNGMNKSREKDDYFYAHTQLEQAAITRAAWSNRQLFEVTVDFLHSRLHVPAHFDKSRDSLNHYDATVIRRNAFGKFSDMVWAMITHPAMIVYLDNQNNTKGGGNQNLGRELLELHTLGVDAGYKQSDVAAAAMLLTGLGVDQNNTVMKFWPDRHYVGPVKVFGKTYPNASAAGGLATIQALVRDLTHHPKTAQYFCLDLARRFVSDAPSAALVKRLAAAYLKYDTAIAPLLKIILTSPEFQAGIGQKYRRPLENTVASIRALGLAPAADQTKFRTALRDLRYSLDQMGQSPLGRTSPDGFPDFAQPWLSSLGVLARWNLQMSLVGGWRDGLSKPDVDALLGSAKTYGAAVDAMYLRLLFQKITAGHRTALLGFLGKPASTPLAANDRADDYNLRVRIPALILGAPSHQLR